MTTRFARLASAALVAAAFVAPVPALAADPGPAAPPTAVVEWQDHLDHMRSMHGNLGVHVRDCVAMHGSMAGLFGPNGSMVEMMGGGMMR